MLKIRFFGVLKKRIRGTKCGDILYRHYRRFRIGHHKGRKYKTTLKRVPSSHMERFKSYK